jgi:hypothetical protein
MRVVAVSGTIARVIRGANGTRPALHLSGETIYVATAAQTPFVFRTYPSSGTCTSTDQVMLPQIDTVNGGIWDCSSTSNWWVNTRDLIPVTCKALLVADMVDQGCFIADQPYLVYLIKEVHAVAESSGTLTILPKKATGTQAVASGTALTAAAIDMVGAGAVAETVKTPTLSATPTALYLAAGNRIGLDFTDDTAGELAGLTVTFYLYRLK